MENGISLTKVFCVRSYEEAHDIETSREMFSIKSMVLRGFIILWVFVANRVLSLLKWILFSSFNPDRNHVNNLVVYTTGVLGDNVLMLPAIAGIKRGYPKANLTVIVNCDRFSEEPVKEIFEGLPYVDKLITLSDHPVRREGFKFVVDAPMVEGLNCNLFINLSPFGNRGLIGAVVREMLFARWLNAKWAVGFKMNTYSRRNIFNKVQHHFIENEARRPREILNEIGLKPIEGEDLLPINQNAKSVVKAKISKFLSKKRFLAILNPGAKLKASQWPPERFGEVSQWLAKEYEACVVLNGNETEKSICDQVAETSGGVAINLAGLSVRELIELLRISDLLITNNTGPMTLAAMIGVPMVVISSTRFSPAFYIPFSQRMVWLFAFSKNSYSYNDEGGTSEDLMLIDVHDVIKAIKQVHQFGS
jgi:heptosyltransferase II